MTSATFKSTGAIIVYSIISVGLLAIAGYNFWGWFGGSAKWKASNLPNGEDKYSNCVIQLNASSMSAEELNKYVTKSHGYDNDFLSNNANVYTREKLIEMANSATCDKYKPISGIQ